MTIKSIYCWLLKTGNLSRMVNALGSILLLSNAQTGAINKLGQSIITLCHNNGPGFTASYLKETMRLVTLWLSGQPPKTCDPEGPWVSLGPLGLPSILPSLLIKEAFVYGNPLLLRLTLTMLWLYRVIDAPVKTKLNTITDFSQASADEIGMFGAWVGGYGLSLIKSEIFEDKIIFRKPRLLFKGSMSPIGIITTLSSGLYAAILNRKDSQVSKSFWNFQESSGLKLSGFALIAFKLSALLNPTKDLDFGKLSGKQEAAGKLRIFAQVDYWTQVLLRPLHDKIFEILRSLSTDGTFDHSAKAADVARTISKLPKGSYVYSFDLSSATDRVPKEIYIPIIAMLFGSTTAGRDWNSLLTGRRYKLSRDVQRLSGSRESYVMYNTGQPMGAYSSWALLALAHHLIVQYSYCTVSSEWRLDGDWFEDYAVIGDDVVIWDPAVALRYLEIMRGLAVPINMSKSVISQGFFEFAKHFYYRDANVTPLNPGGVIGGFIKPNLFPSMVSALSKLDSTLSWESIYITYCTVIERPRMVRYLNDERQLKLLPFAVISFVFGLVTSINNRFDPAQSILFKDLTLRQIFGILYGSRPIMKDVLFSYQDQLDNLAIKSLMSQYPLSGLISVLTVIKDESVRLQKSYGRYISFKRLPVVWFLLLDDFIIHYKRHFDVCRDFYMMYKQSKQWNTEVYFPDYGTYLYHKFINTSQFGPGPDGQLKAILSAFQSISLSTIKSSSRLTDELKISRLRLKLYFRMKFVPMFPVSPTDVGLKDIDPIKGSKTDIHSAPPADTLK